MSIEITHGHLLACTCGAGKPEATHLLFSGFHEVECLGCGLMVIDKSESVAAADWNFFIGKRTAEKLARMVA